MLQEKGQRIDAALGRWQEEICFLTPILTRLLHKALQAIYWVHLSLVSLIFRGCGLSRVDQRGSVEALGSTLGNVQLSGASCMHYQRDYAMCLRTPGTIS